MKRVEREVHVHTGNHEHHENQKIEFSIIYGTAHLQPLLSASLGP